jgi:hypothetical protein
MEKALVAQFFVRNSATDHFSEIFFLTDTPQVTLDLMTPVSSLYYVEGLRKRAVTHTDRQTDFEYYIYRF